MSKISRKTTTIEISQTIKTALQRKLSMAISSSHLDQKLFKFCQMVLIRPSSDWEKLPMAILVNFLPMYQIGACQTQRTTHISLSQNRASPVSLNRFWITRAFPATRGRIKIALTTISPMIHRAKVRNHLSLTQLSNQAAKMACGTARKSSAPTTASSNLAKAWSNNRTSQLKRRCS